MNILKIVGLVFLVCGAYLLFDYLILPWEIANQRHVPSGETVVLHPSPAKIEELSQLSAPNQRNGRCDGRKYCSQMTSCAEARYFLANCPDTEMDGDNDGIPCESQWCGHH